VLRFSYDNRWNRTALELANEVLDRQQGHPAALELRGILQWRLAQDPDAANPDELTEAAERDLRAAVTADPRRAVAWGALSDLLRRNARFAEAKHAAERALEADQFLEEASQIVFRLYETTLELKQWDEAEHWCEEGWRRFSSAVFVNCDLFLAALPGGPRDAPDEAWQALDRIVELSSPQSAGVNHVVGLTWVSAVIARAGLSDSARAVLARARETAADGLKPWIDYYGANTLLQLGDRQGALDLLDRFLEANPGRKRYLASDWMFETLWDDPGFASLVDTTSGR
jgi:serine/threonine-protein kinase